MKAVVKVVCFTPLCIVSSTLAWVSNHQQSSLRCCLCSATKIRGHEDALMQRRIGKSLLAASSSTKNTESSSSSFNDVEEYLAQFDVSTERGFLPFPHDPLMTLPIGEEEECRDEKICNLLQTWDSLTTQLPSLIGAGPVRRVISESLARLHYHHDDDDDLLYSRTIEYLRSSSRSHPAADSVLALEKCALNLSFLSHAYIWCDEVSQPTSTLPKELAIPWCLVSNALGRPPILTYYSYNACNWRRIDATRPVELGNICRLHNFFGGMDEEWFSMVHVNIEALAGRSMAACVLAHAAVQQDDAHQVAASLTCIRNVLAEQVAVLSRMEERSDPYVYNLRVRLPQTGWTDDRIAPEGMIYEGVLAETDGDDDDHANGEDKTTSSSSSPWRRERYFGETGAQSSVIPAVDAALGLSCDASASSSTSNSSSSSADAERAQALVPYLLAMRKYMPLKHSAFIKALEPGGVALREYVANNTTSRLELTTAFNDCIAVLTEFRSLHLVLAQRYVRQWDKRDDDKVIGTGGTAFMPYLRAHRQATKNHAITATTKQEMSK